MICYTSYIYTKRGVLNSMDVLVGDQVVSELGRWTKVEKIQSIYTQGFIEVSLRSKGSLLVKEGTKFYSLTHGEGTSNRAKSALFRHYVLLDRGFHLHVLRTKGFSWLPLGRIETMPALTGYALDFQLERDRGYFANGLCVESGLN